MNGLRNLVDNILVPHAAFERAITRLDQCFKSTEGASEAICLPLVGDSRTGKTRAQEHFAMRHPARRQPNGLIVPILRVSTPSKPTVKGLAEIMLRRIGDPQYYKGTEQVKTIRLLTLLQATETRMIIIDEFQHFVDKSSSRVIHYVADWLKMLVDESRVALVVSGLPACRAVMDQNEQLAGRFLAPVVMPRLDWTQDDERAEFLAILGAFQEGLAASFSLPELDTDEMGFRFWCATGGLIGYITKLLRQVTWNAIDANDAVVSLPDLERAHQEAVWPVEKDIGTLRPFCRKFGASLDSKLLEQVRTLGRADLGVSSAQGSSSAVRRPLPSAHEALRA